jgi:sensor histidine kinase YesM
LDEVSGERARRRKHFRASSFADDLIERTFAREEKQRHKKQQQKQQQQQQQLMMNLPTTPKE